MSTLKKGYKELLAEADRTVRALTAQELADLIRQGNVVVIDVREGKELQDLGRIPGSVHAPRGGLEFYADPDSPFHKPVFAQDKMFVTHCAGGWRSALAAKTLQDMGFRNVAHLAGGFKAWQEANLPVESV